VGWMTEQLRFDYEHKQGISFLQVFWTVSGALSITSSVGNWALFSEVEQPGRESTFLHLKQM